MEQFGKVFIRLFLATHISLITSQHPILMMEFWVFMLAEPISLAKQERSAEVAALFIIPIWETIIPFLANSHQADFI